MSGGATGLNRYDDDKLKATLRAVLWPLADLMINSGITLSSATELLKQVLYDTAQARKDGQVSDSEVSLLTGLHRKDVRRFREDNSEPARVSFANVSARLIAHWTSDPAYLDKDNRPRALPRTAQSGPSFDAMVQQLRFDLPSGTILAHLTDTGLIEEEAGGHLVLRASAYVPLPGSAEMLSAFEKNISAHLRAAVDNLTNESDPHFERGSHFNKLSADSARILDTLARQLAQEQLAAFNAEAKRLQAQDMAQPSSTHRVSFGSYIVQQNLKPGETSKK
ncbi:MAG: DUF6502 family protein [Pseudomonadota bacterium]